jgi:hypothetical protein
MDIKPIITARYKGQWENELVTSPNKYEIDRICGVNKPAFYLYGDTYYTDEALKTILSYKEDWQFLGESEREIFAIKANGYVLKKAWKVRSHFIQGRIKRCIGWELYAYCCGQRFTDFYRGKRLTHWTQLNGCEDFDTVEEYETFIAKL